LAPVLRRLGVGDPGPRGGLEVLVVAEDLLRELVASREPDAVLRDPHDLRAFPDAFVDGKRITEAFDREGIDVEHDRVRGDDRFTHLDSIVPAWSLAMARVLLASHGEFIYELLQYQTPRLRSDRVEVSLSWEREIDDAG